MSEQNRWLCPFCKKDFAISYKYKTHLQRCLIHNDNKQLMSESLEELKEELRNEFKTMINSFKKEMITNIHQSSLINKRQIF
jgi:ABC-type thiamine transport system ATPase subunit